MVTSQIRALRKEHGLDTERPWDIWRDGCEGGEYVISKRTLDDNFYSRIWGVMQIGTASNGSFG
jgi:probable phosphoglycerate mutase